MASQKDRRTWVLAGASAAAVLAVVVTAGVVGAVVRPAGTTRAAASGDPLVEATPALSPTPSPTPDAADAEETPEPEPTPVDTATAVSQTYIDPNGPQPVKYPGRSTAMMMFLNHDPEYEVYFWIGSTRYGPYSPWTRTKYVPVETYAGLVFRLEFPRRHNCDQQTRGLDRPIEGNWGLTAERVYKSRDCATLGVLGEPARTFVPLTAEDKWTPDPAPRPSTKPPTSAPSTTKPPTTPPPSSAAPTSTPTDDPTPTP